MTLILPLILLTGCALCFARPRVGLVSLFAFAILVSNARQFGFLSRMKLTTTFALVPVSNQWVVDSLGVRILTVALLGGALLECLRERRRIRASWILGSVAVMVILGLISGAVNHSDPRTAASALYFMVMSLLFLVAASNIAMDHADIRRLLKYLLFFVCLNTAVQAYQFLFTAYDNTDAVVGLLTSTTPTSTLAFAVLIPVLADWTFRRRSARSVEGALCVGVALVQLLSSYLKGIFGFGVVVALGGIRLLGLRGTARIRALVFAAGLLAAAIVMFGVLTLDTSDLQDLSLEAVTQSGPIRVWREFLPSQPGWWGVLLGYGPGAYGSVNTFDESGEFTGRLGAQVRSGPASRDVFQLALSSAGNILWENGIVVLVLFLWVHYRVYRMSSTVVAKSNNPETRALALGIMGGIVFICFLYMVAFAETLEQPFLWGPAFVAFGAIEMEAKRIRGASVAAGQFGHARRLAAGDRLNLSRPHSPSSHGLTLTGTSRTQSFSIRSRRAYRP